MTIGFDQSEYRVDELARLVEVCASELTSVALDREVTVQYETVDKSAVGMFVYESMF